MANNKNITFDQLQSALARVKKLLDGKANTSHGNHVPKTETANNARFLRNDNTWQTVTPVNIGAADRSHTHGEYINQNTFTNVKIGDTTIEADSPTDTLTLNAGVNVTITPDAINDTVTIEAKDTIYTHPTTPGNRHIPSGGSSGQILRWSEDGTATWGSENNSFASGSVGGFTVTPNNLVGNNVGMTSSSGHGFAFWAGANGADASNEAPFRVGHEGRLYAYNAVLAGTLDGNATTATRLQAAHKFTIGNTEKYFDGSADVAWTLDEIGAAAASHNHTNLTGVSKLQFAAGASDSAVMKVTTEEANTYLDFEMSDDANTDMYRWRFSAYDTNGATPYFNLMTLTAKDASSARLTVNGDVTASSFTGNAMTATKLQTARTITIGNASRNFDGTSNISWTVEDIGAVSPSHTHDRIIDDNNNITIAQANDRCGLDAKNNVNIATWYGFSISNNCSTTDNYEQVTFSVDARSGQVWTRGTVNAPGFSGALYGNANTATTLANSRKFTIGNAERYFNGSADVSWTLDEMGVTSAITQSGNNILNTVSNTYATKDEFNNLKIGGRNYVKNSNFAKGSLHWGTTHSVSDAVLHNGHKSLRISVGGSENFVWSGASQTVLTDIKPNTTITMSCWYYIEDKSTFDENFGLELKGDRDGSEHQVLMGTGVTPNEMENGVWKKLVATVTTDCHWNSLYIFPWVAKNGTVYVTDLKVEYGNKATDWTPAPEDIDESITAVDNKFVNYSTTNQMNSAIQVAENDAKMDIRHNYVTKHEAAHYFEGENKWKLDLYNLGSMDTMATPTKDLMIQNNCQYLHSILVEHPSYTSAYGDTYVGYATTYMHFAADHQWNGQVVTDDGGSVYLNDEFILSTPSCQWTDITLNFRAGWNKVEVLYAEGGGGDGWQFNPEIVVVPGGIMNKMNCYGQNSIGERLNSSAGAWDNAYNRVAEWAYGSVGGSTTINGGSIQANTVTPQQLSISDFNNYSQLRVGHNLSSKYGTAAYVNNDVDNHCYWCNGDNEYFPFTVNETVNPFKYGDKVAFKFDAYVQNALDVRIGIWFYLNNDCNDYMTERTADIHLNPGWNSYSTQVTIDCTEVRRARSVAILIYKGVNNYIEVRNAVISRMISNAMIEDRAVTANKLGTIGGFQVEDRLLRGRNGTEGNNYVGMSGDGFGWAFWAGAYNGGDAPFHVGHEGHLYATNATLAGTLDGNSTTATRLQNARTFTIGNTGKNFDGSGNISWSLDEIGAAPSSHTHTNLVTKTVSNSTLTLGTELYQYAAISSNTTIKLPSVSSFTEIHLFFNWPANVSVTMPSGVKWQQGVMYGPGHVHEFVFTYVNNIGWLGGCVVYG